MHPYNDEELKSMAWRRMHELRTCPPLRVLQAGGKAVEGHIKGCQSCRNLLELATDPEIANKPLLAKKNIGPETPVTAGDIRRIRPLGEPEAWFDSDGAYRNPPLVLVLNDPDQHGFVQVAQLFNEPLLRGPGDIPIKNTGPVFAQAWNVYSLPISGLAKHSRGKVGKEITAQVLQTYRAKIPPVDTSSALYHFRIDELETGASFSMPLNAQAIKAAEQKLAAEQASQSEQAISSESESSASNALPGFKPLKLKSLAQKWRKLINSPILSPVPTFSLPISAFSDDADKKQPFDPFNLKSLAQKWQSLVEALPLAAAPPMADASAADATARIPVLLIMADAYTTLAGDLQIFELKNGIACAIHCLLPDINCQLQAVMSANGKAAEDVTLERGENNLCVLRGKFIGDSPSPSDLRIALIAAPLAES